MAKEKSVFLCNECGYESPKWAGKCPGCGAWNSFVEKVVRTNSSARLSSVGDAKQLPQPVLIDTVSTDELPRIDLGDAELNRVLGGGLVPGSMVLLGGEPGIGKSTLVLQTMLNLPDRRVLYVSGEESAQQIKLRADRIEHPRSGCMIVCETLLETIFTHVKNVQPELLVIDSIQTMCSEMVDSSPGSMSQVRECTAMLLKFAKENNVPVILIGHITKDGAIAGPKILEHIVDVVIQFEGDQHHIYRVLRSIKNRFGSTAELGIYEMRREGLRQVNNPSELLLGDRHNGMSGVAIASAIEGVSPFLIEVQSLVSSAVYGTPQRSATGFDTRRMNMLLAVLVRFFVPDEVWTSELRSSLMLFATTIIVAFLFSFALLRNRSRRKYASVFCFYNTKVEIVGEVWTSELRSSLTLFATTIIVAFPFSYALLRNGLGFPFRLLFSRKYIC